jgi:hypothetical protein
MAKGFGFLGSPAAAASCQQGAKAMADLWQKGFVSLRLPAAYGRIANHSAKTGR